MSRKNLFLVDPLAYRGILQRFSILELTLSNGVHEQSLGIKNRLRISRLISLYLFTNLAVYLCTYSIKNLVFKLTDLFDCVSRNLLTLFYRFTTNLCIYYLRTHLNNSHRLSVFTIIRVDSMFFKRLIICNRFTCYFL